MERHFLFVSILFVALICKVSPNTLPVTPVECSDPLTEYRSCQSSSCEKTCDNPYPQICTLDCISKCFCKDPYVLDKFNGNCVRFENCTRIECSDPLREYRCHLPGCVKTCENPSPRYCLPGCTRGCYCKDPYVLDELTNSCIRIEDCKQLCRKNEEYKMCGTCDSRCEREIECTRKCNPRCYCKKGFVLNQDDDCIDRNSC